MPPAAPSKPRKPARGATAVPTSTGPKRSASTSRPKASPRNSIPTTSKPRATLNVDLGPLRDAVESAASAASLKPSAWIRAAVQAQLAASGAAHVPLAPPSSVSPASATAAGVYRAWFDTEQTAKLDALVARSGRRSRIHVLHALLDGVQLAPAGSRPDGPGTDLAEAVQVLTRSNHELVAFGRNLNQIARSLATHPGRTSAADRLAIDQAAKTVRMHLEAAARLVAELRPLVRPRSPGEFVQP